MYVVAEYLFIENFLINFAILHITRMITRTKPNNKRILMASFLAALYPFVLFLPSIKFLTNFFMKVIISVIIVKIAFNSKSIEQYLKQIFGFFLVSFIFAGASIGTYYFLQNYSNFSIKINDFSVRYLILGIALGGVLIKNVFDYYYEKATRERELYEVTLYFNNKSISLTALLDTGNSLIEPLNKKPVFVVEYEIIRDLIPHELQKVFDNNEEENLFQIQNVLENYKGENIIRIIPFRSIGSKMGILLGFKPDYIEIIKNSTNIICDDLIVGIFNGKLSTDEQYKGLLSLEILNRGNVNVKENQI